MSTNRTPSPLVVPRRTADSERQARSKENLILAGGKRISLNLPQESIDDIRTIMASTGARTNVVAVMLALQECAARLRGPTAATPAATPPPR